MTEVQTFPQLKVLLVEDDKADARLIELFLEESHGVEIVMDQVTRVDEARERLASERYGVVLLDLTLPDGWGAEIVARLRERDADVPLVIITGLEDDDAALAALRAGASDYLVKGEFDASMLGRSMRYAIERKRAQEALKANRERLEGVLASLDDVAWVASATGETTYMSPNTERIYGHPPEVFYQHERFWLQLIHPDDRAAVETGWNNLGDDDRYAMEYRIVRPDGSVRWLFDRGRAVRDAHGRVLRYEGITSDVTESKRIARALDRSETRFRAVVESLGEGLLITDADDVIQYINSRAAQLTGYDKDDLIGQPAYRHLSLPDQHGAVLDRNEDRFEGVSSHYEIPMVRKDGSTFTADTYGTPLYEGDEIVGTIGVFSDISDRKRADEALRASEARQRALLEAVPDLILEYGPDATYLSYSTNHLDDLVVPPEEFLGRNLWEVVPPDVAAVTQRNLEQALAEGSSLFEYELEVPAGRRAYEARMVRTETGNVLSMIRDITERRSAEERLRRQNAYFSALHETSLGLMDRLDLSDVLDRIVRKTTELTGTAHGFFYLVDEGRGELRLAAKVGLDALEVGVASALGSGLVGTVWESGEGLVVHDYQTWPQRRADVRLARFGSVAAAPLLSAGRVIGVIGVAEERTSAFDADSIELLDTFAKLAAIALENARLHERTRTDLRRAHVLYELSQTLTRSQNIDHLFHTVAENVLKVLSAHWSLLYVVDRQAGEVEQFVGASRDGAALEPVDYDDLWEGLSGRALREGKPILSSKSVPDPRESETVRADRLRNGVGSILVVPLEVEGEMAATITALRGEAEADFDEQDLELLSTVANQVQVAIERRRLLDQVAHQAFHDALTSLPNRRLFEDRLELAIAGSRRSNTPFGLLFIDLDGFKHINDTLGHHVGDALLVEVTARLSERVRSADTLARMGGDEFAIILTGLRMPPDAIRVAQDYLELFNEPFDVDGHALFVTASIGVSLFPHDGDSVDALLRNSDSAMYRAKRGGKNSVQSFTPELAEQARSRLLLESELRQALKRDELTLHYQPQIDLETGRALGAEALLRWFHAERGTISPGEFIPVAEESGLIIPIGEWVLGEACRQNAAWQRAGHPPFRVGVNISSLHFARPDFVETVLDALEVSGLEARWLELEITESAVMHDIQMVADRLQQLRDIGVRISIDDFGTGYSSLRYLQRLPIDCLKIDRSFVDTIGGAEEAGRTPGSASPLVDSIVALAHNLNLEVIAEGVETEAQLRYLRAIGCLQAQGYYFAKPLPPAEIWARVTA